MLSEPRLRSKLEQPRWPWLGDAVNRERTSLLVPLLRCVLIAFALPVMRRSEIQSAWGRGGGGGRRGFCAIIGFMTRMFRHMFRRTRRGGKGAGNVSTETRVRGDPFFLLYLTQRIR